MAGTLLGHDLPNRSKSPIVFRNTGSRLEKKIVEFGLLAVCRAPEGGSYEEQVSTRKNIGIRGELICYRRGFYL